MTHSLAWVTPFSKASDIGAFSRNILSEFALSGPSLGISPSIFVNENAETYWSQLPTIPLTGGAADRQILSAFDFRIFNIGNNAENHEHINQLALRIPGVLIVHDMVMQHYLAWKIFEGRKRPDLYARMMAEYYGAGGLDVVAFSRVCANTCQPIYAPWDSLHVSSTPLIEPFVQGAAAVVVHSKFAEDTLRPIYSGPLLRLQLPWDKRPSLTDAQLNGWVKATKSRARCTIAVFGHIGRSKNIETVIQACADSAILRERVKLVIAGFPGDPLYVDQLKLMVSHLGLGYMVDFEFSISDQRLMGLQRDADVFVNLRHPNTESASGSLIEQMASGKPVVIYPTGAYAEVDDGAAVKVDREAGTPAVAAAMERLVQDPAARVRIGKAGRDAVRRVGRREYVEQLSGFLSGHESLLRSRTRCVAGQNMPDQLPARSDVDPRWAEGLDRTRRLLGALESSDLEVDVSVFVEWDDILLRRYIVLGLFGHLDGGALDFGIQDLQAQNNRWQLHQAVSSAYLLTRIIHDAAGVLGQMAQLVAAAPVLRSETWHIVSSLSAEVFVRGCYLGLLGRAAERNEVDRYLVRLTGDNARSIVREFITSDEFKRRGVAADQLRSLREWCEETQLARSESPGILLNDPVEITSAVPESVRFLTAGWHAVERHGVWSRSMVSGLSFRLPSIPKGNLVLSVTGRATGVTAARPRSGTIACDDGAPVEWRVDHDNWFTLRFRLHGPINNRQVRVIISCREMVNPASLGIGPDPRDLGFCLREFLVAEEE